MPSFPRNVSRALASATILSGLLLTGLGGAQAQQTAAAATPAPAAPEPTARPATANPVEDARAVLMSETRIQRLHDRLQITPAQEPMWGEVAQVMRDNQVSFRSDLNAKTAEFKTSNALNDLKTFQIIADRHSSGLQKFIPVFEKLYNAMPADQQKRADRIFIEHHRDASL